MQNYLPNIFSFIRIIIAPFFFFFLLSNERLFIIIACILFIIGAVTDYFDGWLARKYKSETSIGKFIDPLADKILSTLAFIAFAIMHIIPLWMVIIIILRDVTTTLLRIFPANQNKKIKTSYSAKVKTTFQMIFIAGILLVIFFINIDISQNISPYLKSFLQSDVVFYSALLITIFTVWTLFEYLFQIFRSNSEQ